jgi:hypothetical protein
MNLKEEKPFKSVHSSTLCKKSACKNALKCHDRINLNIPHRTLRKRILKTHHIKMI